MIRHSCCTDTTIWFRHLENLGSKNAATKEANENETLDRVLNSAPNDDKPTCRTEGERIEQSCAVDRYVVGYTALLTKSKDKNAESGDPQNGIIGDSFM